MTGFCIKDREVRSCWFGHVLGGDAECIRKRVLRLELAGQRKRGCSEKGHAGSRCEIGRCRRQEEMETVDQL